MARRVIRPEGNHPLEFMPCLVRSAAGDGIQVIRLGHPLLDDYLAFVAARARTSTWLAVASDLKIFFTVVAKPPAEVTAADVFAFLTAQRAPRHGERVVRLEDGEAGLAARTIARRLPGVRGLYAYLCAREDTGVRRNPVPGSLAARRPGARRGRGAVPLIRTPRTLPRVLAPAEVDALRAALRTHRDRAMADAMVLAGCAAAKCSACASKTLTPASGGCSWPRVRAAGSGGAGVGAVLRSRGRLPGIRTAGRVCGQAGVRGAEGRPSRPAAVGGRAG